MPADGVSAPMRMSDDAGMCSVVFAKSNAVDVIVVKPSESRNQAARYTNVLRSRLISRHLSIWPRRFHARRISRDIDHSSSSGRRAAVTSGSLSGSTIAPEAGADDALGNQAAAGRENSAHHSPLRPTARRSESVEPFIARTGISASRSITIPAA